MAKIGHKILATFFFFSSFSSADSVFFWLKRKAATYSSVDHLIKVPGMIGWDMIIINM